MENDEAQYPGLEAFLEQIPHMLNPQTLENNEEVNPDDYSNELTVNTDLSAFYPGGASDQAIYPMPAVPATPQYGAAPTYAPPMLQPTPAMASGPCYHPMVGWYYPAAQPAGVPPPPPHMLAAPMMTPTASFPLLDPPQTRSQSKRKYGPSAYLDARAQGRTSISQQEANYFASTASRRDGRSQAVKHESLENAFSRKQTRPSIVQACICGEQEAERVKRPKNSFILYRLAKSNEIRKKIGTGSNPDVSKAASAMWKNESAEVRQHYIDLAEKEKQRHAEKNPRYAYKPGGQTRARFGTPDCTCGAYQLNIERYQEKKAMKAAGRHVSFDFEAALAEHQQPTPGPSKRKRGDEEEQHQQPTKRRRSLRLSVAGNAEDGESALLDRAAHELFDFNAPAKTPSPTAVETFSNSSQERRGSRASSERLRSLRQTSRESQVSRGQGRRRSLRLNGERADNL